MGYQALLFCPDEKLARIVGHLLSELEFTVEPVEEPFTAVKKLMMHHYDTLVVDCENEQNASLVFKSARNSEANQSSLTLAIVQGQAGVARAYRMGANLALTKPINLEQSKGTLRVARGFLRKTGDGPAGEPAAEGSLTVAAADAESLPGARETTNADSSLEGASSQPNAALPAPIAGRAPRVVASAETGALAGAAAKRPVEAAIEPNQGEEGSAGAQAAEARARESALPGAFSVTAGELEETPLQESTAAEGETVPAPAARPRRAMLWAAIIVAALALGSLGYWMVTKSGEKSAPPMTAPAKSSNPRQSSGSVSFRPSAFSRPPSAFRHHVIL